jgi:hypothetical protein
MRPACQPGKNASSCATVFTSGVACFVIGRTSPPAGASGSLLVAFSTFAA